MIRKFILFSVILSYLTTQSPDRFELERVNSQSIFDSISTSGLSNNSIRHIRKSSETGLFFVATGSGLGFFESNSDSLEFGMFDRDIVSLPEGGVPGLDVRGLDIAVSGVVQVEAAGGLEPAGTGIGFSTDGGMTWGYKPQPVDPSDSPSYIYFTWGEPGFQQELRRLAVTTEIDNVSYDVTILGDYIYAASWAGGLQRFRFKNIPPSDGSDPNPWEPIPLPMDSELDQYCGWIDTDEFELNPKDPADGGSHNHKGFSVHAVEDTLWVGTAGGINKGVLQPGGCINWRHFNSFGDGISGNWVIGIAHQESTDPDGNPYMRIWAITWSTGGNESYGLSYTDDGGYTWHIDDQLTSLNLRIYGISTSPEKLMVASENGLYISADGNHWEKLNNPIEMGGEQLLTEAYFACLLEPDITRTWVGSPDGLAFTDDLGETWDVIRFWNSTSSQTDETDSFYAYPNPIYTGSYNRLNGNSYVRFVFDQPGAQEAKLTIFDFSMSKVAALGQPHEIGSEMEVLWNCRNDWGDPVVNGVYFCRLETDHNTQWTKVVVIND